ncbi:MAG: HEAT repeat domain-containing protein [Thermoplasmata archaeon]|nr:MAG: HEAT repeat domain-containing protein [Thermoplasmata archaeon]
MKRIAYLLILIDNYPEEGEKYFTDQVLDNLYADGDPYRDFVDEKTVIALKEVGGQSYDEDLVAASTIRYFLLIWNHKPNLEALTYQQFGGEGGKGVTILEWGYKPEPEKLNTCLHCGSEIEPGAAFCENCNKPTQVETLEVWACPSCDGVNQPGDEICQICGMEGPKPSKEIVEADEGRSIIDKYIPALWGGNRADRIRAAQRIGESKDPKGVELLIQALRDEDKYVRTAAMGSLGIIGDAAIGPLIQAARDSDWHVRFGAAMALGISRDQRAIDPLISALRDEDSRVRSAAESALEQMGKPAIEPLTQVLNDENKQVSKTAKKVLKRIKKR